MFKFASAVNGNSIYVEYDGQPSDVEHYRDLWFAFIDPGTQQQAQVDALTARLRAANDTLSGDIILNTPSTP